jgi:hypothetical protein
MLRKLLKRAGRVVIENSGLSALSLDIAKARRVSSTVIGSEGSSNHGKEPRKVCLRQLDKGIRGERPFSALGVLSSLDTF